MTRQPQPPPTRRERRELERRDRPLRDRSRTAARRPANRPAWQSPFALVTAAALVVAVAIIVLGQKPAPPEPTGDLITPPLTYAADIVDGELLGRADAAVLMEVWADYQCPVCARWDREHLGTLKTQFVDTGILRIQARDIAFLGGGEFDESLELAVGARCAAEQNRFWPFHDLVYWNQGRENEGDHNAAFIASLADRSGVDRTAWDACVAGEEVRDSLRADTNVALGKGINSTPTISLNGGTPVPGLPDLNVLVAQIQALAGASATLVPPASTAQ
ncbi:MAG TPA: thioredoxin domain-containing protein [Candidatus Sulfomarinibacteraceae bacterium]|nr:thioredoxin domain-containing protein [Candidatus Sulfomarinibacteraceae bacterium]